MCWVDAETVVVGEDVSYCRKRIAKALCLFGPVTLFVTN